MRAGKCSMGLFLNICAFVDFLFRRSRFLLFVSTGADTLVLPLHASAAYDTSVCRRGLSEVPCEYEFELSIHFDGRGVRCKICSILMRPLGVASYQKRLIKVVRNPFNGSQSRIFDRNTPCCELTKSLYGRSL
jgi:hypothetical protein